MNATEKMAETKAELERLQARIKELEREARAEREAARKATRPERRFFLEPNDRDKWQFDRILDPAVKSYRLVGQVTNKEACKAAGYSDDELKDGSMSYLFNEATGRLITSSGGGMMFLNDGSWGWARERDKLVEAREDFARVVRELSEFLVAFPDGGEVTAIVRSQRHMGW